MGRAAFATRVKFGWLAMFAALGALSCEQFDPVKSDNLCERDDGHAISMLCPQCSTPPFAWQCSECFKMLTPDPERCEPRDAPSPSTDPDGGGSGAGGSSGGEAGEGGQSGEAGEGGEGGESGAGGAGEGGAGSGGMSGGPMSGAGGEPMIDPFECVDDFWCMANETALPACLDGRCVECTRKEHCTGDRVCNTTVNRCQNCVVDADCASGACNEALRVCVECQRNEDCKDEVKNACDTTRFVCVDCVGTTGCDDPEGIKTTCQPSAQVCVDCLDDPDCAPDKPACNKQTRECVECTDDRHCSDSVAGSCDTTTRTCVDCVNNQGCAGTSKPQCDPEAKACVECLEDAHCASGHCLEQVCVQCKVDDDCPSATASHCDDETHRCVGCTSNAHCEHLEDTQACSNRRCVECNDDTTCNGFSCIRAQHVCSDVRRGTRGVCNECQADSMCQANMACVPLSFSGDMYGTYCVYTRSSRQGSSCSNARPYAQSVSARSIDGATSSTYCVPPATTSCPGVLDVAQGASGSACQNETQCGLGIGDAVCSGMKCTYVCGGMNNNCPDGLDCLAGGFCG